MNKVRRYDLDWLRVGVFALLIFYHVGMFFVPWGWHLKNNESCPELGLPMLFLNQFVIRPLKWLHPLFGLKPLKKVGPKTPSEQSGNHI